MSILCINKSTTDFTGQQFFLVPAWTTASSEFYLHIPRHAKSYRNFSQEFKRLQEERVDAFQEFYNDVQDGIFPDKKNIVEIPQKELDVFLNTLEKKG